MHKRMNVRTTGLGGVCRNAGVRQRNECRRKACKMRRGGSKDRPSDLLRLPAPTAFLRLVRVTALPPFFEQGINRQLPHMGVQRGRKPRK